MSGGGDESPLLIRSIISEIFYHIAVIMSKRKKRLERIRQNPKNVSFEDLRKLLEDYGFVLERSSGSHHSFKVEINGEYTLFVVPYRRPVKPNYVRDALKLIDEIEGQLPREEDEDDESDS
jgi:predicted RNA binding protein YcfA (HicA-like mRNA interferase family)